MSFTHWLSNRLGLSPRPTSRRKSPPPRLGFRPTLEAMEDRLTPSTLTILGDQLPNHNDTLTLNDSSSGLHVNLNGQSSDYVPGTITSITVNLGDGANTIHVEQTVSSDPVTIHGGGSDTVNIGVSSSVQGIQGTVSIDNLSSFTTLNIDDSGDSTARTAVIVAASIHGLSPADIHYDAGVAALTVYGGSGGNVFNVLSTAATTPVTLDTGSGDDQVYVQATSSPLYVDSSGGNDAVFVGSTGTVADINGPVDVRHSGPGGVSSLFVQDGSDPVAKTNVILNDGSLTGLAPAPITWTPAPNASPVGGVGELRVTGGYGGNTYTVNNTSAFYHFTFLSAGAGSNQVNVRGTTGELIVQSVLGGHNDVTLGSLAPSLGGTLANLNGPVYIVDQTYTNLVVDDSGSTTGKNVVFGQAGIYQTISGMSPAPVYFVAGSPSTQGVRALNVHGGRGDDAFSMTSPVPVLSIDGGLGTNTLDYFAFTTGVTVNLLSGTATGLAGTSRIQNATGGGGDDTLIGNDLDNVLRGSGGNDLLLGLGGNDRLYGGDGRDLLIGGFGADLLDGGSGDDILVGGYTKYDTQVGSHGATSHNIDLAAFDAIMQEWTRTDAAATYHQRIDDLMNGVGLNGLYQLNKTTVSDDGASNSLTGGTGLDWFFASKKKDTITDKSPGEHVTNT